MTIEDTAAPVRSADQYRDTAADHLWRHFAEMAEAERSPLRVIVRGEGCYLFDADGNRFLDGLASLFCVNIGYSYGDEIGQAAQDQYAQLPYAANWGTTHPRAIELAEKVASLTPAGLDHVFFTPSGGESVEAAWKVARQYFRLRGENRWKAIARDMAYHGTSMGALSLMGIPAMRTPFEPLVASVAHVRNTKRYGRPADETEEEFTRSLLDDLEQRILSEDPDTIAMIIIEPVQNHGGMLTPPKGYPEGVRALADKYGILLVLDETITGFGRIGEWFGSTRYGFAPDIITTAKGLSSSYAVIGATIVSDEVFGAFAGDGISFLHGNTFGGHPVMAAVALKNLEIMERLDLPGHVRAKEAELEARLRTLEAIPVVVDVRGAGFFWAVELDAHMPDGTPMTDDQLTAFYGADSLQHALEREGILLRLSTDGGDPVLCIAPPLVADIAEFDVLVDGLHRVLTVVSAAVSA